MLGYGTSPSTPAVSAKPEALSELRARLSDWAPIFRIPSGPAVNAPQRKGRILDGKLYRRFKSVISLQHRGRPNRTTPSISLAKRVLSTVPSFCIGIREPGFLEIHKLLIGRLGTAVPWLR